MVPVELLYFLLIVLLWGLFLWILKRAGAYEKPSLSLMGPLLAWKTERGKGFLERLARAARFWRGFGDVSIALVALAMIGMTALLLWMAVLVVNIPAEQAPTPDLMLGIPGVNRLIPITYGIFGLAVAIVIHEFCHGILARVAKIKVRDLGLLFFVVPIGAFVEPDEDEMKAMPRRARARLYAVGPAVNILFALLMAFIFSSVFMGSVTPVARGVGVAYVEPTSPADGAGITAGMILVAVNGTDVPTIFDFQTVMNGTVANQTVLVSTMKKGWSAPQSQAVVLADAYAFTHDETRRGKGFLGIRAFLREITTAYFHPIGGSEELGGLFSSALIYISLPFTGLQPMQGLALEFFEVHGPLAGLGDAFWVLANVFYWLFWLNLMLGLTNALPAVPLDGGYIFRDGLHALIARVKSGMSAEARDRVARNVSYGFALLILALVLWQFIGPRVL